MLTYPNTTLYSLKKTLKPLKHKPHSIIKSSYINTSIINNIYNNSNNSLIQHNPTYTKISLFTHINKNNKLTLINHLKINLNKTPKQILNKLNNNHIKNNNIHHNNHHTHNYNYIHHIHNIKTNTPTHYNTNPNQLFKSSNYTKKLTIFTIHLNTFKTKKNQQIFYINTNQPKILTKIHHHILTNFKNLPITKKYIHQNIYNITKKYNKNTFLIINKLNTNKIPFFFNLKKHTNTILKKIKFFHPHFTNHTIQKFNHLFPNHLPPHIKN